MESWKDMHLLVWQPDGTVREGTLEDWKEHARFLSEQADAMREIADVERDLRLRRLWRKAN